jgi:hypothetical protein
VNYALNFIREAQAVLVLPIRSASQLRTARAPLPDGTRTSSAQAFAKSIKNERTRNTVYLAFDEFSIPSLCRFQPSALDVCVGRCVEVSDELSDQLDLIFRAELADFSLDLCYCSSHACHRIFNERSVTLSAVVSANTPLTQTRVFASIKLNGL